MTIGELAGRAGIRPSRIRYYESIGVLPPPRRQSRARRYDDRALETLRSVLVAQRLGLSLAEIRAVASGERRLPDVALEHARELDATIRRARVRLALLRHAAHTTQLSAERAERYERVLAKAEGFSQVKKVANTSCPHRRIRGVSPFFCIANDECDVPI